MKSLKSIILTGLLVSLIFSSCKNTFNKPLNKDDFEKVKELLNDDMTLKPMKKKYIIDNLSMYLGFSDLGKAVVGEQAEMKTYGEYIDDFKTDYDSIETQMLSNIENNNKLREFITLIDAKTTSNNEYKGYLTMKLKFKNEFEKQILYALINYKYINKYDTEFFDEIVKLTDEVAKDFKGELEITTTEEYNDVAEFMYKEVPVQASLELRKEMGTKAANEKVEHDFLMDGLKIETIGLVFTDKTELTLQNEEWEYLE